MKILFALMRFSLIGSTKTRTPQATVRDMCCVLDGEKRLLVTSCHSIRGVHAYDTTAKKFKWHAKGKVAGMEKELEAAAVTGDGRGHLFVVDYANSCVQMFKTDGSYMGAILKYADNCSTEQWRICWCAGLSSLIVASKQDNSYHVGVFKISSVEGDSEENSRAVIMAVETAAEYNWKGLLWFCSIYIITTRQQSCGKVMFSQASVHGGG